MFHSPRRGVGTFFFDARGLISRVSAKNKVGVFSVFLLFLCFLGGFVFFFARYHGSAVFLFCFSGRAVSKTGNSRSACTICHAMSRFFDYGLPFPSQGGHAGKRPHSGSCLDRRDRATGGFGRSQTHQKPGEFFDWRGFAGPLQPTGGAGLVTAAGRPLPPRPRSPLRRCPSS